jgi:hypothetical protein
MFKKALSVFVLIIFLAHFAGFYIYFFTQLQVVRQEMRAKLKALPPEELELFTLSTSEYQKAKVEDHEIKIVGKMYDIARIVEKNGKVLVYCLHDKAEDGLLSFLDKILKLPLKDKKTSPQLVKFTILSYILPSTPRWGNSAPKLLNVFTHYHLHFSSFFPSLESPPPRLGLA